MEEVNNLKKLSSGIWYYLLDWKDRNMSAYVRKYGETKLRELSNEQLHDLFCFATTKDTVFLAGELGLTKLNEQKSE